MATIITRPNNAENQQTKATPVEIVTTGSGTIDEGALSIGFLNSGSAAATINGAALPAGAAKNFPYVGKQYMEIAVDATGTTVEICAIY